MEASTWPEEFAEAVRGRLEDVSRLPSEPGRLTIDSREVKGGDVFVALPGRRQDGHEFAADAFRRGASLLLVKEDRASEIAGPKLIVADTHAALRELAAWHRRRTDALVIGVTGSVGKTTTRELIYTALKGEYAGTRSRGNFNNEIGLPLSLLDIRAFHEFAVLEMGAARVGDIASLADLSRPEVGVVTAIGTAHLETFGSVEGILRGKGELLEALPAGGFGVIPGDCPKLQSLVPRARCRVITVGEGSHNHLRMTGVERSGEWLSFRVDGEWYRLRLASRQHLTNALCAIAIGREIGLSGSVLSEGLAGFEPVAGRGQVRQIGPWRVIDDTYNASPTAFAAALESLRELALSSDGRRIVVAGDMLELGGEARPEHVLLGERIAGSGVDRLLVIGHHAEDVVEGALSAGFPAHHITAARNWDTLLLLLECWLEPGDTVLVKGSRAMRMERVIEWMTAEADARFRFQPAPFRRRSA